jgi:hypothetical protein
VLSLSKHERAAGQRSAWQLQDREQPLKNGLLEAARPLCLSGTMLRIAASLLAEQHPLLQKSIRSVFSAHRASGITRHTFSSYG